MDFDQAAQQGLTKEEIASRLMKEKSTLAKEILECRGELRLKRHAVKAMEQEIEDLALELEEVKEAFTMLTDALLDMLEEQCTNKITEESK